MSRSNPVDTAVSVLAEMRRHPVTAVAQSLLLASGVAITVVALAVGLGAARANRRPVRGLAPNLVVVSGIAPSSSGVDVGLSSPSLTSDDVQALSNKGFVPDGVEAVPTAGLRTTLVSVARTWKTDVIGSTPDFAAIRGYTVAEGRFLTATDIASATPAVVVGQTVVNHLFAGSDPVGQQVQINNRVFQVVGVLSPQGRSGTFDQDDLAVVPITTAWSDLFQNTTVIDQVLIKAVSVDRTQAVKTEATNTLLQRHQLSNPVDADFEVRTLQDVTAGEERAASAVKRALALAAVALLVGSAIYLNGLLPPTPDDVPSDEPATGRHFRDRTRRAPSHPTPFASAPPGPTLPVPADLRKPPPPPADPLVTALTRAAVATMIGVVVAAAFAGAIGHLVGAIPPPDVTPSAVVSGIVIGLMVGGAAWLPNLVRLGPAAPAPSSAVSGGPPDATADR